MYAHEKENTVRCILKGRQTGEAFVVLRAENSQLTVIRPTHGGPRELGGVRAGVAARKTTEQGKMSQQGRWKRERRGGTDFQISSLSHDYWRSSDSGGLSEV